MTDLSIFTNNPIEDKGSMQDFLLANSLAHNQIATAMQQRGLAVISYPLTNIDSAINWLSDHTQIHENEFAQLGLVGLPNLEDVDFDEQQQYHDWQELHAAVHQAVSTALGLV
jgi:hypothetical protein